MSIEETMEQAKITAEATRFVMDINNARFRFELSEYAKFQVGHLHAEKYCKLAQSHTFLLNAAKAVVDGCTPFNDGDFNDLAAAILEAET